MTEEDWKVDQYAENIHEFLRNKERHLFIFKGQSPQLKYRTCLVDWLDLICEKMEFSNIVQHLATYLLDIFMDNHDIHADHLQMVALGCLIVAVKLEEKDSLIPKNSDFNALIGNKYSLSDFIQMEVSILTFFKWDILFPTAAHFADYYELYAFQETDKHNGKPLPDHKHVRVYVHKYLDYFLEISLRDIYFTHLDPSLVAASCVCSTRICLLLSPPWPDYLVEVTHYKYQQLKSCMRWLIGGLDADVLSNTKLDQALNLPPIRLSDEYETLEIASQ